MGIWGHMLFDLQYELHALRTIAYELHLLDVKVVMGVLKRREAGYLWEAICMAWNIEYGLWP